MSKNEAQKPGSGESYSIIVADTARLIRELFRGLRIENINVMACVKTSQELETALKEHSKVDAVFCDVHFSGEHRGLDRTSELRARGVMPLCTALVLMSEDNRRSTLMAGMDALPDTILLKPFNIETLHRKLELVVPFRQQLAPLLALEYENRWEDLLEQVRITPRYNAYEKLEAKALIMLGQHQEGARLAHSALQRRPNVAWAMEAIAHAAYRLGEDEKAEQLLIKLLNEHPYCLGAYDLLAAIHLDRGDYVQSQNTLHKAIGLGVHNYQRNKTLGHIAFFNDDLGLAKVAYHRAFTYSLENLGNQEEDLTNLLRVLYASGEVQVATQILTAQSVKFHQAEVLKLFHPVLTRPDTGHLGAYQQAVKQGLDAIGVISTPVTELAALELAISATLTEEAIARSERLKREVVFTQLAKAQQVLVDRLAELANRQNGLVTKALT